MYIGLALLPIMLAVQGSDDPVIRTSTRLVQVNVVVHGKNGPVADLTKSDFVLTDRGRRQTISVFSVESKREAG